MDAPQIDNLAKSQPVDVAAPQEDGDNLADEHAFRATLDGDVAVEFGDRPLPPDEALSHVVDDASEAEDAILWACARLLAEQTVEQVIGELEQTGWSREKAEELAEVARRRTRAQRGIITRDDIAALEAKKYRAAWRLTPIAGMPAWASLYRLLTTLAFWRTTSLALKRRKMSRQAPAKAISDGPDDAPAPSPAEAEAGFNEQPPSPPGV